MFFSLYSDWHRRFNSLYPDFVKIARLSRTQGHIPEHNNILFSEYFGVREIEIDNIYSVHI
jgi:hypothetical protein